MTKNFLNSVVIIPARFESTRFPGKPLEKIAQKTMIQHVYERAAIARRPSEVIVATDDKRIKLAGKVVPGSIQKEGQTLAVKFQILDPLHTFKSAKDTRQKQSQYYSI